MVASPSDVPHDDSSDEPLADSPDYPSDTETSAASIRVVGLGASAGGLAALEEFFRAMPADSGMAFVVIQHLSPDFKSLMEDLLARHTRMPIHRVSDGALLEPNAVY